MGKAFKYYDVVPTRLSADGKTQKCSTCNEYLPLADYYGKMVRCKYCHGNAVQKARELRVAGVTK